jgi:hypothetical protein
MGYKISNKRMKNFHKIFMRQIVFHFVDPGGHLMILVTLAFTHYGPKSSESGIKAYFLADTSEEVVAHIDKTYLFDALTPGNPGYEDKPSIITSSREWRAANPEKMKEAMTLGFEVDEWFDIFGPKDQLIRWYCGNDWEEISDSYYGVTQYNWQKQQVVSNDVADQLVALGIAVRLPIAES